MPRYYFHLAEGADRVPDTEGVDLEDVAAAVAISLNTARDIMSADIRTGHLSLEMRLDIENEAGHIVHAMPFTEALTISFPKQ